MIARIWHGRTSIANYDAYTGFLKQVAIPDYQKTVGFKGLTFLRNVENDEGHFKLITYWDDLEIIKNFAGQDLEKAKYYLEDKDFLLEFEERVHHYEVFATSFLKVKPYNPRKNLLFISWVFLSVFKIEELLLRAVNINGRFL